MANDDITQRLALLPEGLAEENIQSWQHVLHHYEWISSSDSRHLPMLNVVHALSELEQIKLFRGGNSLFTLIISTKERHGLEKGDKSIGIDGNPDNDLVDIFYLGTTIDESESFTCKSSEVLSLIQPLLDRLWSETRGKKNV